MTEEPDRVLRPGHRIALDKDVYTVIQLSGTAVTLQDQHGELSAVMLGYLLTAPGFQALDSAPPRRVPQDGRLAALSAAEQERVRWLEGHLIDLETGQHPGQPSRDAYNPALHDIKEREQSKLAEFEAAGRSMTRRHLQRLRRTYREEGLIGLADRRKLREITPGAETDPRVISIIEKMLAEPRGRSTVARSVMFTELQRRIDDEYGPGVVPVPDRRTLYRLMIHMDRGRRNFVSEASRRTAVNRPNRPFPAGETGGNVKQAALLLLDALVAKARAVGSRTWARGEVTEMVAALLAKHPTWAAAYQGDDGRTLTRELLHLLASLDLLASDELTVMLLPAAARYTAKVKDLDLDTLWEMP